MRVLGPLNNPVRDAEAVAKALQEVGFKVTVATNPWEGAFLESLSAFREASRGAEAAAFYYARHGAEQGGVNYLIPVDMQRAEAIHDAVELDEVLESMQGERNLLFLDADRTPLGRTVRGDSPPSRGPTRRTRRRWRRKSGHRGSGCRTCCEMSQMRLLRRLMGGSGRGLSSSWYRRSISCRGGDWGV